MGGKFVETEEAKDNTKVGGKGNGGQIRARKKGVNEGEGNR